MHRALLCPLLVALRVTCSQWPCLYYSIPCTCSSLGLIQPTNSYRRNLAILRGKSKKVVLKTSRIFLHKVRKNLGLEYLRKLFLHERKVFVNVLATICLSVLELFERSFVKYMACILPGTF